MMEHPSFKAMKTGDVVDPWSLDKAKPAPIVQEVWAPEDANPWTAADDQKLRVLVQKYTVGGEVNWMTVALKANFGHNSGSCQKRFEQLPKLKYADANVFVFANGTVEAKKKEFI